MSKKYLIKICIFLFFGSNELLKAKVIAQSPTLVMSLQECIDYALKNSAGINNANLNVEISRRRAQEVLSVGLPQVSGQIDIGGNFERPYSFLPSEIVGGEPGTFTAIQFSPTYTGRMVVDFEQMLFVGSFFVGLEAAKAYVDAARKNKIKSEVDLVDAVSKAYYRALVNHEQEKLIKKNYARLDSLLRDTRIMRKAGFAEQVDVDRVLVQHNNAKVEKENFEQSKVLSYALLKFQMNMDINTPLTLKDRIEDIRLEVFNENMEDDFKYEDRIEYNVQEANINLLNFDIKNTQSLYLPTLHVYGNYGMNVGTIEFSDLFGRWVKFGTVGLRLRVPIFDGLQRTRLIQQKKLQLHQLRNTQEQLKQDISLEIKQAKIALQKSIAKMASQSDNIKLAENIYRVSIIKYEAGVESNINVINADATLTEAQTNYHSSLYDALIAKINLDKAYGKLLK